MLIYYLKNVVRLGSDILEGECNNIIEQLLSFVSKLQKINYSKDNTLIDNIYMEEDFFSKNSFD